MEFGENSLDPGKGLCGNDCAVANRNIHPLSLHAISKTLPKRLVRAQCEEDRVPLRALTTAIEEGEAEQRWGEQRERTRLWNRTHRYGQ